MTEDQRSQLKAQLTALLRQVGGEPCPAAQPEAPGDSSLPAALLIGQRPSAPLGFRYVSGAPYEAVVLGSLTYAGLLSFREDAVFEALAQGKPVYLWAPGLPHRKQPCQSRPLLLQAARAERELRSLGAVPLDAPEKRRYVSAAEARRLKEAGQPLPPGALLSPLAKELWEQPH